MTKTGLGAILVYNDGCADKAQFGFRIIKPKHGCRRAADVLPSTVSGWHLKRERERERERVKPYSSLNMAMYPAQG